MARITGQQGASLTNEIAQYLDAAGGQLSSTQLQTIINKYIQGGDQLTTVSGVTATGIYKRFNEFDKVEGKIEVVTAGLFSNGSGEITTPYHIDTEQSSSVSGQYYWNVYDIDPATNEDAESDFALAYGNRLGGGADTIATDQDALQPTRATYVQYRSLLLDPDDNVFTFVSGSPGGNNIPSETYDSDEILIINISRARYRERMDPGNWEITFGGISFIDDSGKKFTDTAGREGRVFNVVKGDLNEGTQNDSTITSYTAPNGQGFGLFYPEHGIIILNPTALASETTYTGTVTGNDDANISTNFQAFLDALGTFKARRTENISTSHYFVRATNREFNFSNNPTFVTGNSGRFSEPSFETDPRVYITTVGLYDDANEMLAVAKSSTPITKSFDKELLIKVKLSF